MSSHHTEVMPATTTRRSQADRSATTKAALADAAIEVLTEQGWAAVTAIEVCNRVGVSRGAFHHHFVTARETMLGLALGRATNGGRALGHERRVLARLRAEATRIDAL